MARNPCAGIPQKDLSSLPSFSFTLSRLSLFIQAQCSVISSYSKFSSDAVKIRAMMMVNISNKSSYYLLGTCAIVYLKSHSNPMKE